MGRVGLLEPPLPPSTSELLAPTNATAFLLIGFTRSFYVNKQLALGGASSSGHSRARRC